MMDYLMIYLWTRLDAVSDLFCVMSIIGIFVIIASVLGYLAAVNRRTFDNEEFKEQRSILMSFLPKIIKRAAQFTCIFVLLTIILPGKKDTLLIYFIPKIAKSEAAIDTMDIINKLPKVLQKQINEYLAVDEAEHD